MKTKFRIKIIWLKVSSFWFHFSFLNHYILQLLYHSFIYIFLLLLLLMMLLARQNKLKKHLCTLDGLLYLVVIKQWQAIALMLNGEIILEFLTQIFPCGFELSVCCTWQIAANKPTAPARTISFSEQMTSRYKHEKFRWKTKKSAEQYLWLSKILYKEMDYNADLNSSNWHFLKKGEKNFKHWGLMSTLKMLSN